MIVSDSMLQDSMLQKVDMPGLWFLKSSRPSSDISDLIYELSVKGCAHFFVRSQFKTEIQKEVLAKVMKDYLDGASDENERNRLELGMSEYKEHGFFYYPEELNDYVENGYFWCDTAHFLDDLPFMPDIINFDNNNIILEDISELEYDDEKDLLKILQLNQEDAIRINTTVIIFVQDKDYGPATEFIEKHLFD